MKFLECDLEEIIMKSRLNDLQDRGLEIEGHRKNQLRIGNYGIADIVTYSKEPITDYVNGKNYLHDWIPKITVYELKKDKVSLSTFAQGIDYIRGIQDYFNSIGRDINEYRWELVLIGREVDKNSCIAYLTDLITSSDRGCLELKIFEYNYDIDGLYFKEAYGYYLIKKGFKI